MSQTQLKLGANRSKPIPGPTEIYFILFYFTTLTLALFRLGLTWTAFAIPFRPSTSKTTLDDSFIMSGSHEYWGLQVWKLNSLPECELEYFRMLTESCWTPLTIALFRLGLIATTVNALTVANGPWKHGDWIYHPKTITWTTGFLLGSVVSH